MCKLNLGCGTKKMSGYVNVDVCGNPDIVWDLSVFPWPFENDSADEIYSSHFLEHVVDFDKTVLEIHRILKPRGVFHARVPHYRNPLGVWHLHKCYFSTHTFNLLCQEIPYLWGGKQLFIKEQIRVNFPYVRKSAAGLLAFLANLNPIRWDYLGLPIDEVEFVGRKNSL